MAQDQWPMRGIDWTVIIPKFQVFINSQDTQNIKAGDEN
jgi:hypothetical protein